MRKSLAFNFLKNMFIEKRIDEPFIVGQVKLKRITKNEAEEIINTAKEES